MESLSDALCIREDWQKFTNDPEFRRSDSKALATAL